jgi:S-adenosylmethionine hydrolase
MFVFRTTRHSVAVFAGLGALILGGCAESRKPSPVVALLTDYGVRDAYVGVLNGAILTRCPNARLVTITHEAPDFDIQAASFLLGFASRSFPADTVFCTVVVPGVGTERRSIILRTRAGRLFVGPDNGTFTDVIAEQGLAGAWKVDESAFVRANGLSQTFHGRDVYGPVAGLLAGGTLPEKLGVPIDDPITFVIPPPVRDGDQLRGVVRHVDGYGNIVTNIPGAWVPPVEAAGSVSLRASIHGVEHVFRRANTYADVPEGAGVALVNSLGVVELARNEASAGALFGVPRSGDTVVIGPSD